VLILHIHLACCRDDFIMTDNSCKARMQPKNVADDIARTFEAVRAAPVSATFSCHTTMQVLFQLVAEWVS
jgi:hypothetical protein